VHGSQCPFRLLKIKIGLEDFKLWAIITGLEICLSFFKKILHKSAKKIRRYRLGL
jgi:hypothetical protein